MLIGKLSQAAKFVDSENDTKGVHTLTGEIKQLLLDKHPKATEARDDILFEEIDITKLTLFQNISYQLLSRVCSKNRQN